MSIDDSQKREAPRIARERRCDPLRRGNDAPGERRAPDKPADPAARREAEPSPLVTSVEDNPLGNVSFDHQGNAVWEWRVDVPRRRADDDTVDLLACLDPEGLSLADDEDEDDPGFDPYDKS